MNIILAVFIGGGVGSLARYGMSKIITSNFHNINPYATLVSNLLSTLVLGFFTYYFASKHELSGSMKAFILIGFCGGFSTFSTFSFEILELIKTGNTLFAVLNIITSVALSVFMLYIIAKLV